MSGIENTVLSKDDKILTVANGLIDQLSMTIDERVNFIKDTHQSIQSEIIDSIKIMIDHCPEKMIHLFSNIFVHGDYKMVIPSDIAEFSSNYFSGDNEIGYIITPYRKNNEEVEHAPFGFMIPKEMQHVSDFDVSPVSEFIQRYVDNASYSNPDFVDEVVNDLIEHQSTNIDHYESSVDKSRFSNFKLEVQRLESTVLDFERKITTNLVEMRNELLWKIDELSLKFDSKIAIPESQSGPTPKFESSFDDVFEQEIHFSFEFITEYMRCMVTKYHYALDSAKGAIHSSFCVNDSNGDTHTYYFVVKGYNFNGSTISKQLPCMSLIGTRIAMNYIGVSTYTELAGLLLMANCSDRAPGTYDGKFGSINLRNQTRSKVFAALVESITCEYEQQHNLQATFDICFEKIVETFKVLKPFQIYYKPNPSSQYHIITAKIHDDELKLLASTLPSVNTIRDVNLYNTVLNCASKCIRQKDQRKGMMYGSLVIVRDGKYVTPCGVEFYTLYKYFQHPCTVRAKAFGIYSIGSNPKNFKNHIFEEISGTACKCCGRVYKKYINSQICNAFCDLINNFSVCEGELIQVEATAPYGNHTVYVEDDVPLIY